MSVESCPDFGYEPPLVAQGKLVCVSEERWAELERHQAEDQAAIREVAGGRYMDEDFVLNDDYWYPRWQIKHAAALQRAREGT